MWGNVVPRISTLVSLTPFLLQSISQFFPPTETLHYTREVLMKPWKAPGQSNTKNSTMDGPCLGSSQTISTNPPITLRTSTSFVVRWRPSCSSLQFKGGVASHIQRCRSIARTRTPDSLSRPQAEYQTGTLSNERIKRLSIGKPKLASRHLIRKPSIVHESCPMDDGLSPHSANLRGCLVASAGCGVDKEYDKNTR